MENLIVRMVKYRGYLFSSSPEMVDRGRKFWFFSLKEFDRYHVETKKNITKYAFRHGSKVGATSNGVRTFNMTFTAFASSEEERFRLIQLVSAIFNPPGVMSDTAWFHDLEFMTPDGTVRTTKAQVTTRPKIFDFNNQNWATFQVELVGKDWSFLFSKQKQTLQDTNTRLWFRLPISLPDKDKYYRDTVDYHGTSDAPVNVTITAKKDVTLPWVYIRTLNGGKLLTTMELWKLTLQQWDQIIVDSYEETIYKLSRGQKIDLSNQLSLNSEWPRLLSPVDNNGLIAIVDCGFIEKVLEIERNWSEIWD